MKLSHEKIVQQAARAGRRTLQLGEEAGGRIRRLSKRSWLILAGIAVLTVGGLWWWLRPEPVKPILPVVQVEPAETDDIELYGEYVGRIRAQQFVEIRARVEGFLEKMLFEEGTYVKKGQPLFIIDPKLYEARVNKAKAQLNKDKALELKADRDLKRIRPLYEQNAASQLDLDNAIASYESATASVAMSEADLTQAETALSYTTVSSPLSGFNRPQITRPRVDFPLPDSPRIPRQVPLGTFKETSKRTWSRVVPNSFSWRSLRKLTQTLFTSSMGTLLSV